MRALVLALIAALVAGCGAGTPETPPGPSQDPRASDGRDGPVVVLLDARDEYALDRDIPPRAFLSPGNATHLGLTFFVYATDVPGCGSSHLDPDDPAHAWLDVTSPSGATVRVDVEDYVCRLGLVGTGSRIPETISLSNEAGEWSISYLGRGTGVTIGVTVEATLAD